MNTETITITGQLAPTKGQPAQTITIPVPVLRENKRGCGYRKAGGTYIVNLEPSELAVEGMPIALHVCPTCHGGIKFCRGFTWINARALLNDPTAPERAGLIWIGESFYPTPQHFIAEALAQGVSRRLATVPTGLPIGETRIYFAHSKGMKDKSGEFIPAAVTWFVPTGLQYVVRDDDDAAFLHAKMKRGITPVRVVPEDTLLVVPPTLSPRLEWKRRNNIVVHFDAADENFRAAVAVNGSVRKDGMKSRSAATEEDAIAALCAANGIKTYEQEQMEGGK